MQAMVQDVYGTADVLRLEDVERPEPAAGQVLVRVAAASVNAADWHVMRGEPKIARLMNPATFGRTGPRQRIRGRDFAGTVEALGPGVTGWNVGDEVLGEDDATFAEYATAAVGLPRAQAGGPVVRGGRRAAARGHHRRPLPGPRRRARGAPGARHRGVRRGRHLRRAARGRRAEPR